MTELSVQQMLANLEAQIELHREREAHHAREEAAHREQRETHAAELAALLRHYEALKSSVEAAAPLAVRHVPVQPKEAPRETLPSGKPVVWSRLVDRVVAEIPDGEVFSPADIAAAVSRRFQGLPKEADSRVISTILRRMAAAGGIRMVRKGTSHREASYTKA
jgi:alkylated DNA nucleotide flippase Atl1